MKFIKLAVVELNQYGGLVNHKILVNVNNILSAEQGNETTNLVMSNNTSFEVKESPEEILEKIKEATNE